MRIDFQHSLVTLNLMDIMAASFLNYNVLYQYTLQIVVFLSGFALSAQERNGYQLQYNLPITDTNSLRKVLKEGIDYMNRDIVDSAEMYFSAVVTAGRRLKYFHGMATAFTGLSDVARYSGDNVKAFNLLDEAEKNNRVEQKTRYEHQKAVIQGKRGQINDIMGNYDIALRYYLEDMKIREKIGIPLGHSYNNIGQLFRKIGNYDKSIYYLDLAEIDAVNHSDSDQLCTILLNKAMTLEMGGNKGKRAEIIRLAQKSLDIARKIGSREMQRSALSKLGGIAVKGVDSPDYKTALRYLEEAIALPQPSIHAKVMLLTNLTFCYNHLKDFNRANIYIKQAQELAEQSNSRELSSEVYKATAFGYREQGDYKNALDWYFKAVLLKDSISGTIVAERVNRIQVQYESVRKDNELIRKELLITKQQAIIQQKNTLTYSIISIALLSIVFSWVYYRNKRRMRLQTEKQALEMAAWQASIAGEEKERSRIARELHDNIGGTMSNLQMWLGTLRNRHKILAKDEDFTGAMNLLAHTITEVRNTAHHLMPELLLRLGLAEAVRIFCANIQKVSGIKIEYQYIGYISGLDKNMELVFYRGIQELVQNVVKHASASFILVQLSRYKQILSVTVEDNGSGMQAEQASRAMGIGLESLRRSISHLGGHFSLRSEPGNGTTIYFECAWSGGE